MSSFSERELTLLLVRHGETSWNAENRWQGQQDTPLSDTGREQARRLRDRLLTIWNGDGRHRLPGPPESLYVSNLSRAIETAETIAAGLPTPPTLKQLHLLRERSFGSWEGLTAAEVRAQFGDAPHPEDGEQYAAVYDRMLTALAHIWDDTAATERGVALVVGHGGSLRMLLARALHVGLEESRRFRLDNTGISVVTFRGMTAETSEGRLLVVNDTAHLHGIGI
jgi:broad specificity phosphatase PhoE